MKQTAVECLHSEYMRIFGELNPSTAKLYEIAFAFEQAKEMEKKQLFLASNTPAKEAYKAGQQTMHCGCYEISDALTYEEWLYENFTSE